MQNNQRDITPVKELPRMRGRVLLEFRCTRHWRKMWSAQWVEGWLVT